jgi:hypothetical protein
MKFFSHLLVLGLAADATLASSWFSKAGMCNILPNTVFNSPLSTLRKLCIKLTSILVFYELAERLPFPTLNHATLHPT